MCFLSFEIWHMEISRILRWLNVKWNTVTIRLTADAAPQSALHCHTVKCSIDRYMHDIVYTIVIMTCCIELNNLRPFSTKSEHFKNVTPVHDIWKVRMTFHVLPYNLRTEHRMDKVWLTFWFLEIQGLIWYAC